jgi:hypothetical protein
LLASAKISRALDFAADAIAFAANTRRQSPEPAGAATELAVRQLCAGGGVEVLYKKIDWQTTPLGRRGVICDAESEDDLCAIAHATAKLRRPAVFGASAGFARYLPQAFGLAQKRESASNLESMWSANEEGCQGSPESNPPRSGSASEMAVPLLSRGAPSFS